jgi:hypothetical protein
MRQLSAKSWKRPDSVEEFFGSVSGSACLLGYTSEERLVSDEQRNWEKTIRRRWKICGSHKLFAKDHTKFALFDFPPVRQNVLLQVFDNNRLVAE